MELSVSLSVLIAIIGFIGMIAVTRYMVSELKKIQDTHIIRLDRHGDDLVALNTKAELAVTAKDVDEKFVSKELFKQFEKHLDMRFDNIEKGQARILEYIRKRHDD